jgi:hypothetical protein
MIDHFFEGEACLYALGETPVSFLNKRLKYRGLSYPTILAISVICIWEELSNSFAWAMRNLKIYCRGGRPVCDLNLLIKLETLMFARRA